ncbi:hypothetical protein HMPREF0971_00287 [Segatella oris F0302]|uniref:Uncharacterized protein n=1 Tax=Segatella oris F0302 TaxID=649760 RepID=D1QMZ8_9BACT|nr:hypothetical protein HMPREF0971_00287 [Segatella oris F0302]
MSESLVYMIVKNLVWYSLYAMPMKQQSIEGLLLFQPVFFFSLML